MVRTLYLKREVAYITQIKGLLWAFDLGHLTVSLYSGALEPRALCALHCAPSTFHPMAIKLTHLLACFLPLTLPVITISQSLLHQSSFVDWRAPHCHMLTPTLWPSIINTWIHVACFCHPVPRMQSPADLAPFLMTSEAWTPPFSLLSCHFSDDEVTLLSFQAWNFSISLAQVITVLVLCLLLFHYTVLVYAVLFKVLKH